MVKSAPGGRVTRNCERSMSERPTARAQGADKSNPASEIGGAPAIASPQFQTSTLPNCARRCECIQPANGDQPISGNGGPLRKESISNQENKCSSGITRSRIGCPFCAIRIATAPSRVGPFHIAAMFPRQIAERSLQYREGLRLSSLGRLPDLAHCAPAAARQQRQQQAAAAAAGCAGRVACFGVD